MAQARTRARRRLVGAVVLLGVGVIAFPLLFESEPRPIPVDLPIEIPKKDGAPPLAMPPAAPERAVAPPARTGAPEVAPPPSAPIESPTTKPPAPAPAEPPAAKPPAAVQAPEKPATQPTPAPTPSDGARAKALLEGKAVAPAGATRYVVQIGAFVEARTVRDVREKAAKAGIETYTQVVTVASGDATRVRIGPFATRDEAEAAAAKARKAGLPATVLKP